MKLKELQSIELKLRKSLSEVNFHEGKDVTDSSYSGVQLAFGPSWCAGLTESLDSLITGFGNKSFDPHQDYHEWLYRTYIYYKNLLPIVTKKRDDWSLKKSYAGTLLASQVSHETYEYSKELELKMQLDILDSLVEMANCQHAMVRKMTSQLDEQLAIVEKLPKFASKRSSEITFLREPLLILRIIEGLVSAGYISISKKGLDKFLELLNVNVIDDESVRFHQQLQTIDNGQLKMIWTTYTAVFGELVAWMQKHSLLNRDFNKESTAILFNACIDFQKQRPNTKDKPESIRKTVFGKKYDLNEKTTISALLDPILAK